MKALTMEKRKEKKRNSLLNATLEIKTPHKVPQS